MCWYTFLFLAFIAFVVWALRGANNHIDDFRLRLPAAVGAGLVLASFVTMPWVSFSPFGYLVHIGPELIEDQVPGILTSLFRLLGHGETAKLMSRISDVASLPGWMLLFLMPTKNLWIRLVILLVGFTGLTGLFWFTVSLFIQNRTVRRSIGAIQSLMSFLVAVLLLLNMPTIDAWGSANSFIPDLITLVSGAHMGWGVWVAWIGLLLLGLGNLLDVLATGQSPIATDEDLQETAYGY
jgi:hypothetical protein